MADFERELCAVLDELSESELDELIGDIELEANEQPDLTGLFDGKGHKAMKRNIKKKTAATIAALVAALGITATAGAAVLTNGFKGADHDKAVANVLGEGNVSGEAKTDSTGHLKIRSEKMLCDGRYAVFAVSLEPVDEIGEQYINENKGVSLDMGWQYNSDGYKLGFSGGGSTSKVIDGCIFVFSSLELTPPYGYPDDWKIGDETITGTAKINLAMTDTHIINGEGDDISELNYEIKKNTDFITLKGDKGHNMELSQLSMRIDGMVYRTENHPLNADTNEYIEDEYEYDDSGINVGYNDSEVMTVEYSDGSSETFVGNDTLNFISYVDVSDPDEMGFDIAFKKEIDTQKAAAVTINGERFTVEQS